MSTAAMEIDQMSAFLLTSSFFCWNVGGLRLVDMVHFPSLIYLKPASRGCDIYIVMAFNLNFHIL